jgi:hypothetical protein
VEQQLPDSPGNSCGLADSVPRVRVTHCVTDQGLHRLEKLAVILGCLDHVPILDRSKGTASVRPSKAVAPVTDPHTQIAAGLEQSVILTSATLVL